jgi:hypothetical protein
LKKVNDLASDIKAYREAPDYGKTAEKEVERSIEAVWLGLWERREERRKRMNEEEKAMKERLFGLASDLKLPEKNGRRGDGSQKRKKGCMEVC